MSVYPNPDRCRALLDEHGVPLHIRRHSETVARLAQGLALELAAHGENSLDRGLLAAAALLHDIAKAQCFVSHGDHAREGGKILRALGFDEMAVLVERHVDLGPWDPAGPVTEAELLNYADKRVRHEEVVSLADRFADLLERYGGSSDAARKRIAENWSVMVAIEEKLFRRLPFSPDALQTWDPVPV